LKKRGLLLDPDLVIVNVVDFHLFKRWPDVIKYSQMITYYVAPNGKKAYLPIDCSRGGHSLRDPDCKTDRILELWMPESIARDKNAVNTIRQQAEIDMAQANVYNEFAFTALSDWIFEIKSRTFNPMSNTEIIENAVKDLHRISDQSPNTLIIVNPWFDQVIGADYIYIDKMLKLDPKLAIVDMRVYLPKTDRIIVDSWYNKEMHEKWSAKGHIIYASAVEKAIKERLNAKQFELEPVNASETTPR
jgi:hypothetical protein